MSARPARNLVEIFGYAPDDLSDAARAMWRLGACPYIQRPCTKANHDGTLVYGTCSVTSPYGDCVVCPNRLYEGAYQALRKIAAEVFDPALPFFTYAEFVAQRGRHAACVVALGQNSGREIKLGRSMAMDWVLARVEHNALVAHVGVEVQSIDITGNYRDCWHAYRNLKPGETVETASAHGLNWANVHKRLIPQIIRKGLIYSRSKRTASGLYFVVPEIVYRKFEDIVGKDLMPVADAAPDVLTVHTYGLGAAVAHGEQRKLEFVRECRFSLDDFSQRFIAGANLPSGDELDFAVCKVLGLTE